jgi:ABC-2 type transport system ATP-binding protein
VAIIDQGRVRACDTPAALKRRVQQHPLFQITLEPGENHWDAVRRLPGVHAVSLERGPTSLDLKVALHEEAAVGTVVQHIVTSGSRILTLKKVEPTLEDVFVELVGHGLAEQDGS